MFNLRYYQQEAGSAALGEWDRGVRSTAIILPTGCGKTEIYLWLAVNASGRTLVAVHRDYLISSPVRRLQRIGFNDIAIEKARQTAERNGRRAQIVFASVQSIGPESQQARLESFNPKDFDQLIIDEAHRGAALSYRRVQSYFQEQNPKLKTLLLTATPKRKDGITVRNLCDSVAYEMSPADAVNEGWIVPPRFYVRDVPGLDFIDVGLKGSDFDKDRAAAKLLEAEPLHKVCAGLMEGLDGPTIVFCPRVDVAKAYAKIISDSYAKGRAVAVHEASTDEEMEAAARGLADGSLDFLFNVDKITEGYDLPRVARVAWACPTASLVRWCQGCGRGLRPDGSIAGQLQGGKEQASERRLLIANSPKPRCDILTFHPSNMQHQICGALDLLGGEPLPPIVLETAKQIQRDTSRRPGGSDPQDDLKAATALLDLRAALEEHCRVRARATVVDTEYDGMGGSSVKMRDTQPEKVTLPESVIAASWGTGEPASDKQIGWLRWKGLSDEQVLSFQVPGGKFRAVAVRDLFELGVSLKTALGWPRKQALAARDKKRAQQQEGVAG